MEQYSTLLSQLDKLSNEASGLWQFLKEMDDRKTITSEFLKGLDVFMTKVKFCREKEIQFNTEKTKPSVTRMIEGVQALGKQIRDLSKRNRLMRALSSVSLRRSLENQILELYTQMNAFIEEQEVLYAVIRKKLAPKPAPPSGTTSTNTSTTSATVTSPTTTTTTSKPADSTSGSQIQSPVMSGANNDVLNMIPDPSGRKLWSELGQNAFSVPWSDFLSGLSKQLLSPTLSNSPTTNNTIPPADAKALRYILDPSNNNIVTSFKFSEFLKCFGPLANASKMFAYCLQKIGSMVSFHPMKLVL